MSHGLWYGWNSNASRYEYHYSNGVGQDSGIYNPYAPKR